MCYVVFPGELQRWITITVVWPTWIALFALLFHHDDTLRRKFHRTVPKILPVVTSSDIIQNWGGIYCYPMSSYHYWYIEWFQFKCYVNLSLIQENGQSLLMEILHIKPLECYNWFGLVFLICMVEITEFLLLFLRFFSILVFVITLINGFL